MIFKCGVCYKLPCAHGRQFAEKEKEAGLLIETPKKLSEKTIKWESAMLLGRDLFKKQQFRKLCFKYAKLVVLTGESLNSKQTQLF